MFEPIGGDFLARPDASEKEVLSLWEQEDLLRAILAARAGAEAFVFYEGPPTANGLPGVHHVLSRALKDSVCRYQTMSGKRVERKAGWDTHGLPVELEVEKMLGISGKPQIEELGIGPFNQACRDSVWKYKGNWEGLSKRIGYLLDYEDPYVTYHADYVESVWFLLSRFAANDLLYRGHKVLPWCGRCGTGLSSHEVGQGYQDIDDPSVWISFPLRDAPGVLAGAALVAWTTTPWTLPSNMGTAVHPEFDYAVVERSAEAGGGRFVLLAEKADEVFGEGNWQEFGRVRGGELAGLAYEPLFELEGLRELRAGARRHVVAADDFVSAEDGTGVVHLAPYGADDFRLAQQEDLAVLLAVGEEGRFLIPVGEVAAGTFFKTADKELARDLKRRGRMLKQTQYRHSYPHCWRCETPLMYFPAPAWFLRTTVYKDRMVAENARIRWVPSEIGSGRFGEWLANNVDWALSRDRFWGTPLPVWVCDADEDHWDCLASFAELAARAGGLPAGFDPHRPGVDAHEFACSRVGCGGRMRRVPQVVDCWFDSGAMPFAQHHWPFENRQKTAGQFPADYICEGLDQTRGWFYTLHAIGTFLTSVDQELWASGELWGEPLPRLRAGSSFKSCLVNGILLDAQGRKMSKRLGNRVDPELAIAEHGADAIRWSMLGGGSSHLSKRYDDKAIGESRRRVLGTLCASYDFLGLYARTENWDPAAPRQPFADRPALDRWILERATGTAEECAAAWESLEPHRATAELERFLVDELSNWYIRRSRRRFWGAAGEASQASAFATLYEALHEAARMLAPIAPFLADAMWRRLAPGQGSVHLAAFPRQADAPDRILHAASRWLPEAMDPILRAARLGRAVRERVQLRVRQPLAKLLVHVAQEKELRASPRDFESELREELNVKEVVWVDGVPDFLEVRAKPNFPRLGKRAGKDMKALAAAIQGLDRETLFALQDGGTAQVEANGSVYELSGEDVQLETLSVAGLEAASDGAVTIGLSTEISPELAREGLAREVLNRVQTQRKEAGLEISDRIALQLAGDEELHAAVAAHAEWIAAEALAEGGLDWVEAAALGGHARTWELPEGRSVRIALARRETTIS